MMTLPRIFAAATLAVCLSTAALLSQQPALARTPDVIFVPTPHEVVAVMLELAEVDNHDVVYDLGCGDGRLVITAAKKYGASGVGIDIDPERIQESVDNARKAGVAGKVKFVQADLFETDISPATAVTLYLLPSLNVKLRPRLMEQLKPGTPIVSHDFDMGDWKPDVQREVTGPSRTHKVYMWRVPAKAAGTWQWQDGEQAYRLVLQQQHQDIGGKLYIGKRYQYLKDAKLSGDRIQFRVPALSDTHEMTFTGRIVGEQITGQWTRSGRTEQTLAWSAQRVSDSTVAAR